MDNHTAAAKAACAGKTLTRFASIQPTLIAIWL